MNGKGDKNRTTSYSTYNKNYEDIAWDFIVCSECGMVYKYDRKDVSVKYDYESECWKCVKCNFN